MKNIIKLTILSGTSLLISLGLSSTANAAVVTYDFTGSGGDASSYSFTESGLTVTATATYNGFSNFAEVNRNSNGLGVDSGIFDLNNQVDGFGQNDYLTLTFDATVEAIALDFANNTSNDEFDFYVGTTRIINNAETTPDGWINLSGLTGNSLEGTTFTIRANQNNDNFRVQGMQVNYAPAVPEPSTYAMFGMAFAILGVVGYRSRKDQK